MNIRLQALIAAVFCSFACAFAQPDSLRITGRFTGFADSTYLYLVVPTGDVGSVVDSARVVNNRFFLRYHLPEAPVRIQLTGARFTPRLAFWAGNEELLIEGDQADFGAGRITGSPWHVVEEEIRAANPDLPQLLVVIRKHIATAPAMEALLELRGKMPLTDFQQLYDQIPEAMRDADAAKKIASYLAVQGFAVPQIGDALIDFEARDPEGRRHSLAELNDRYVLLEFGSAYCGPCLFAIPELTLLQTQASERLRVISFSMDIRESTWRMGLEKAAQKGGHPDWLQLWDGEGDNGKIPLWYGVRGMPTFFLFDPKGRVVDTWEGYLPGKITDRWREIMAADREIPAKE